MEGKSVYLCEICGNMVEMLREGNGKLICCNKPMKNVEEKYEDTGMEKHVPIIERTEKGIKVKVGSIEHPMESNHYIEWIEVVSEEQTCKKFLKPGEKPEAEFNIKDEGLIVRAYCNIHGLWSVKIP